MTPQTLPDPHVGARLLTPAEVAEMLQVRPSWVVRNAADIGGFKLGKSWRFRREDVQRYVERQARRAA